MTKDPFNPFRRSRRFCSDETIDASTVCRVAGSTPAGTSNDVSDRNGTVAVDHIMTSAVYRDYLRSDAWRNGRARQAELASSAGRCRLCAGGEPEVSIEVHHRTYGTIGRERAQDLTTLCRPCHELVTTELRRRAFSDATLPVLSDTPRVLPERRLANSSPRR